MYYEKHYIYEKTDLKKFIYNRKGLTFDVYVSAYNILGEKLDEEIEKLIDDKHIYDYLRQNNGETQYVIVYNLNRLSVYALDDAYGVFI